MANACRTTTKPDHGECFPVSWSGLPLRLLRTISSASYLPHDELKRFLKASSEASNGTLYSRDNLRRFERRVEEVKNLARDAVRPVMRNFLELDLTIFGPAGLGYLTCTRIEDADFPWEE